MTSDITYNEREIATRESEIEPQLADTLSTSEYAILNSQITDLNNEVHDLNASVQRRSDIESQLTALRSLVHEIELEEAKREATVKLEEQKQLDNQKRVQDLDEATQSRDELAANIMDIAPLLTELSLKRATLATELSSAQTSLREAQLEKAEAQRKATLVSKGQCPECGQDVVHAYEHKDIDVAVFETKIATAKVKVNDIEMEHTKVTQQERDTQRKLDNTTMQKDQLEQKIADLQKEPAVTRAVRYIDRSDEKETASNGIAALLEDLSALPDMSLITAKTSKIRELNAKLVEADSVKAENAKRLERNAKREQTIQTLEESIADLRTRSAELLDTIKVHKDAKEIFDKSLPNYLIIKTCGVLQAKINEFLRVVFPQLSVELVQSKREGLEFLYTKAGGNKRTVKLASGFEKEALSVAFRAALCQSYNLGFIVLDECDSMANDNSSELMFDNLVSSELFNQMFVISHKNEIKEVLRNSARNCKVIHVEYGVFKEET
jgi:DNA repair exonuclease SbcCD ATPase subunit